MIKTLDQANYQQTLEITYMISKNLFFNYPIGSLRKLITQNQYRDSIIESIQEIEFIEGKKIDFLSSDVRDKYLFYFDELLSRRSKELLLIDKEESLVIINRISESLADV